MSYGNVVGGECDTADHGSTPGGLKKKKGNHNASFEQQALRGIQLANLLRLVVKYSTAPAPDTFRTGSRNDSVSLPSQEIICHLPARSRTRL